MTTTIKTGRLFGFAALAAAIMIGAAAPVLAAGGIPRDPPAGTNSASLGSVSLGIGGGAVVVIGVIVPNPQ